MYSCTSCPVFVDLLTLLEHTGYLACCKQTSYRRSVDIPLSVTHINSIMSYQVPGIMCMYVCVIHVNPGMRVTGPLRERFANTNRREVLGIFLRLAVLRFW